MTTPIYNDPNHPHYGIIRRIHLILLYLYGDDCERIEERIECQFIERNVVLFTDWTDYACSMAERGRAESRIARSVLRFFDEAAHTLKIPS